tara:strand:- start:2000 stop:4597 length:2598 start_codon:yes stop_codon:yes gene_type:complete
MNEQNNSAVCSVIKQHAMFMGDCIAVYDLNEDSIIENTDCFDDIVNIVPKSSDIKVRWLAKIKELSATKKDLLLSSSLVDGGQHFDYLLKNKDGTYHHISQINYLYVIDNKQLLLIVLHDFDAKPQLSSITAMKFEGWRGADSSQLRHIRKIVSEIYEQTIADFVMIALPTNSAHQAKSLVTIQNDEFLDDLNYDLHGTPCGITVSGKICVHKSEIQSLYPLDTMLVGMGAQSYAGVPFFNDNGEVFAYLVLISQSCLEKHDHYRDIIAKYQSKLNRRLQLYIADQHLSELTGQHFDSAQFSLGAAPSSNELIQWAELSAEMFNTLKEAIFITNKENIITNVNHAFTSITGYDARDVIGQKPDILSSGVHDGEFYLQMDESLEKHGMWEGEITNKTKQGRLFTEWLYIRVVYDNNQQVTHNIAAFSDISVHKEREELLYYQANYDPLTMLPNRSLLFFSLADKISSLDGDVLHIMHLDLKGLARINENYDYNAGDSLLIETSRRLKRILPEDAFIARISGDNFIIILDEDVEDNCFAETMAEKIIDAVAQPIQLQELSINICSNIGIASCSDATESVDNLYSMAEQALLKAKSKGQDSFFTFDEKLQLELRNRWLLEQELALAIIEDQFVLFYQPQVDAKTHKLVGVEALVRWLHPTKGLLSPIHFIPLAEQCDQIVALGNLILNKACQQISFWSKQYSEKFNVSVNISPRQFALEHAHHTLNNIIESYDIDKSWITLEITEDVLMTEHIDLLEMFDNMRKNGIELSLDDFGTGFSSLSYLQQYPLNELKIDQSFVRSLGSKPESQTIVKAIIAMAKGLDLKVVAEGVETKKQMDILTSLGCDIFQGYYFAKPIPADELASFIKK